MPRHSTDSLSTFQSSNDVPPIPCMHTRNACVRVRVRSCLSFFSLSFFLFFFPAPFHPQARDPPREGTFFLTGGGPQRRRFFYFTPSLSHSTPSTVFPPLSFSLSLPSFPLASFFPLFFSLSLFFTGAPIIPRSAFASVSYSSTADQSGHLLHAFSLN